MEVSAGHRNSPPKAKQLPRPVSDPIPTRTYRALKWTVAGYGEPVPALPPQPAKGPLRRRRRRKRVDQLSSPPHQSPPPTLSNARLGPEAVLPGDTPKSVLRQRRLTDMEVARAVWEAVARASSPPRPSGRPRGRHAFRAASPTSPTVPHHPAPQGQGIAHPLASSVRGWTVDQVCGWLGRLGLSHDYAALARVQHITGAVLLTMSPADWIFLGVRHSRDLIILNAQLPILIRNDLEVFRHHRRGGTGAGPTEWLVRYLEAKGPPRPEKGRTAAAASVQAFCLDATDAGPRRPPSPGERPGGRPRSTARRRSRQFTGFPAAPGPSRGDSPPTLPDPPLGVAPDEPPDDIAPDFSNATLAALMLSGRSSQLATAATNRSAASSPLRRCSSLTLSASQRRPFHPESVRRPRANTVAVGADDVWPLGRSVLGGAAHITAAPAEPLASRGSKAMGSLPIDYSADFALPEVVEDTGTPPPGTPPAELAQDLRVLSDDALEDVP